MDGACAHLPASCSPLSVTWSSQPRPHSPSAGTHVQHPGSWEFRSGTRGWDATRSPRQPAALPAHRKPLGHLPATDQQPWRMSLIKGETSQVGLLMCLSTAGQSSRSGPDPPVCTAGAVSHRGAGVRTPRQSSNSTRWGCAEVRGCSAGAEPNQGRAKRHGREFRDKQRGFII